MLKANFSIIIDLLTLTFKLFYESISDAKFEMI